MSPDAASAFGCDSKVDEATEDPMGASPPALHLSALILVVMAGAGEHLSNLDGQARRYTRRIVATRAPDVPEDVRDEIANQALAALLRCHLADLEASGLEARGFFRLRVIEALRQVRASYAPAGQRTRLTAKAASPPPDGLARPRPRPPIEDHPDLAAEAAFGAVERRRDADAILAAAPPLVAQALRLICFGDLDMGAAAAEVGLSRFALKRRISRFAEAYRMAA
jgi:hypothetical protein